MVNTIHKRPINGNGEYLEYQMPSSLDEAACKSYFKMVMDEGSRQSINRILINALGGFRTMSIFELYTAGIFIAGEAANKNMRLAIVRDPGVHDFSRFLETVIRNHGGNIRIFADRAPALHWLLGRQE